MIFRHFLVGLLCIATVPSCKRHSDATATMKLLQEDPLATELLPYVLTRFVDNAQLSPNGKHLAVAIPQGDTTALVIIRIMDKKVINTIAFQYPEMVGDYVWANDDRVVIEVVVQKGSLAEPVSRGELYSMDVTEQRGRIVFGYRVGQKQTGTHIRKAKRSHAWAKVISGLPSDLKNVLIASRPWSRDKEINPTIYKMEVEYGRKNLIATSPVANARFVLDPSGDVRFAIGTDKDGKNAGFYRSGQGNRWEKIESLKGFSKNSDPLGFLCNDHSVLALDSPRSGPAGLYTIDISTGEKVEVFWHDEVEPTGVVVDPATCKIIAVEYHPDFPAYRFLDKKHPLAEALSRLLSELNGAHVEVSSMTVDGKLAVMHAYGDRTPGKYYLVDISKQSAISVYSHLRGGRGTKLSEMRPFKLKARDGLALTGYITFPAGEEERNLPMVVLPHGGPHYVRDYWGYDSEAQLIASQGFAVLQVNFRGSGGFGDGFMRAGFGEWGGKVQQDIIDATRWAISEGIADKNRVCIYGNSFGAYSAIQSTILAPKLFRCAVGYSGIYDLNLMYELGDIQERKSGRVYLKEAIGKDHSRLSRLSPVSNADKIEVPVMLAHGEEDRRAPIEHAIALRNALKKKGIECEWIKRPREGHGFSDTSSKLEFYTHLIEFLRKHIQPERIAKHKSTDTEPLTNLAGTDYAQAFEHTQDNQDEIQRSQRCGCYFCSHIFYPSEVREYKAGNSGKSAVCPKCGTDSVIGSASGYPITEAFLKHLRDYWLKNK